MTLLSRCDQFTGEGAYPWGLSAGESPVLPFSCVDVLAVSIFFCHSTKLGLRGTATISDADAYETKPPAEIRIEMMIMVLTFLIKAEYNDK